MTRDHEWRQVNETCDDPMRLICDRCGRFTFLAPEKGGCLCVTTPEEEAAARRAVEERHREAAARLDWIHRVKTMRATTQP